MAMYGDAAVKILLMETWSAASMRDVAVISWSGEDAMALTSPCSLWVCYPARPQAVQTVALALELPPRYLSFAVLFMSLWKKQASLDTFFGKAQTSRYWRHRADADCRCCWRV